MTRTKGKPQALATSSTSTRTVVPPVASVPGARVRLEAGHRGGAVIEHDEAHLRSVKGSVIRAGIEA